MIIANQDKIIFEVEQENKKCTVSLKSLDREVKRYKAIETDFKALKTACGLD